MGEMTIKGYAERRVECDIVEYTLEFKADGMTIPEAVQAVNTELEHFLDIMEKSGVTSDMFELEDNNTSEKYNYNNDNEKSYRSVRKISIRMPLSTRNINSMMQYIAEYNLNVVMSEEYLYSDMQNLHRELLKEAIEDSKSKAELIASFTEQKIKGIKSVTTQFSECSIDYMCQSDKFLEMIPTGSSYAENLSSPIIEESENVEVIWLIED